jgi:alpha-N-arabinofuranosidase
MNGTIAAVHIYRGVLSDQSIAEMSGIKLEQIKPQPCTISINVNKPIGRVSPLIFGHFLEHFQNVVYGGIYDPKSPHADKHGFRTDVIEAFKQLGPSIVRWPGGNYTSGYKWRWGATPQQHRPTIDADPVWKQTETHQFGTPEFVEFCRRINAQPLICVGVGRDPRSPTAQEAAEWVRYCNTTQGPEARLRAQAGYPEPFNVIYWGLGNEVYGRWQIGGYRDPQLYAQDIVKYARAMRQADPRIKFIICGTSFKPDNTIWNKAVMTEDVLQLADWISYHSYTHLAHISPRLPHEVAMQKLIKVETEIQTLAKLNSHLSQRAGRKKPIKLALDEWNEFAWDEKSIENNARPETYNLSHALFTASFFNIMLRHANDVIIGNYAPSINCRGLIYAHQKGIILRSTYHVFKMYSVCAEGTAIHAEINSPLLDGSAAPVLDAAAVRSKDHTLNILVVNRNPANTIPCQIKLKGFRPQQATGQILTGKSLNSYNDFEQPNNVAISDIEIKTAGESFNHNFAPHSVTLMRIIKSQ